MTADGQSALIWCIIGLIVLFVHFVPSYVAFSNNHPAKMPILILNILFGWTIIGWILLLIWASKK